MQERHECERCHRVRTQRWLMEIFCNCPSHGNPSERVHWVCKAKKSCREERRKFLQHRIETYWNNRGARESQVMV